MPELVNNSQRLINIEGAVLVPGVPALVTDDVMQNQTIMDMMNEPAEPGSEKKTLEIANVSPESGIQERSGARGEHGTADSARDAQQHQQSSSQNNPAPTQQPAPQHPQATQQGAQGTGQQRPAQR